MKKKLLTATLLSVSAVLAQTNDFLTWEACLEKTRTYNPDLVSARAAVRELEFGIASASSGFLPQIDGGLSAGTGQTERDGSWTTRSSSSASLSLKQDLFTAGGNTAKRRRAIAQLEIGNEQYRKTLSDVELRTRLAYIDVLYAQDLVELTEKIEERRSDNVRLIQLRFDGGRENAGSLARSKAQLAQSAYEVREARRSLEYALRNLAAAMGMMEMAGGATGDLQANPPDVLGDLVGLMKQTPNYVIATTQIEAARQGMKVTRSARFPQVNFRGSAGIGDSTGFEIYDANWGISLNASMPIYTGNQLKSDVAAAKEKIIQSEMDLMDTANTLMATLQQRWNSYADAVENEAVQKQLFEAEELRAKISTTKYKQGLLSYEDWDIIESNLINQGKTHLLRRRTSEQEQARWKNALGWSIWQSTEKGE
ncbi:TolC family protein [Pontiellaceae bacterium B12227]|nr:TolC family protein [Pontiellaceae bacterium B12227]